MSKRRIIDLNSENDIKYKAPLSYRHIRILAWIMMILVQVSFTLASMASVANFMNLPIEAFQTSSDICGFLGQLAVPLFLLANFALILSSQENIKKLVLFHASMAVLIIALYLLLYDRYFVGIVKLVLEPFGITNAKELGDTFIRNHFTKYLTLNVFIDLLMCSLLYLFLVYRPKKIKQKHLIYYRLLVIIPILYEIGCMVVKGLSIGQKLFVLPMELIPFLTNKPFVTFIAFIVMILYLKNQHRIYLKLGGSEENYKEYLKTNKHSFQVGIVMAICFASAGIIDFIITLLLAGFIGGLNATSEELTSVLASIQAWGFGKGLVLLFASPLLLLFNYQKKYSVKSKNVDMVIPIAGLILCALALIEGFYQIMII